MRHLRIEAAARGDQRADERFDARGGDLHVVVVCEAPPRPAPSAPDRRTAPTRPCWRSPSASAGSITVAGRRLDGGPLIVRARPCSRAKRAGQQDDGGAHAQFPSCGARGRLRDGSAGRRRCIGVADRLDALAAAEALGQRFDHVVEHRDEEHRDDRRAEHAADHAGADRMLARRRGARWRSRAARNRG